MIERLTRQGLSGATVHSIVSAASAMFSYGVRIHGSTPRNPTRDLERGDRPSAKRTSDPRYLSREEIGRLLSELDDELRAVAAVMFWAGLRVSEALALRWRDIKWDEKIIDLSAVATKTDASRLNVPLLPDLTSELQAHRKRLGRRRIGLIAQDALIFTTATGRPRNRRNTLRAVSRAGRRAGLQPEGAEPIGNHDLRHSLAAYALGGGLSLVETSRVLRHANAQVTATVYAGLTDEAVSALGGQVGCDRRYVVIGRLA